MLESCHGGAHMASMKKERDMTGGIIWKELLIFFFPLLLSTLFQQLYNAVDAIIVGKFAGTQALAAVGGSPAVIINLIISVFVSLTTGSAVIIAQLYGAGKIKELRMAAGTSLAFFFLLGAALTAVCEPFVPGMLHLLGTPEDTVADAAEYLYIYFSALPVLMLVNAQMSILRAVGDSKTPLIFMIICCILNIILDLLFVVVFRMGVPGVAWATVASMFVNAVLGTVKLFGTKESYRIKLKELKPDMSLLKRMMEIGIPSAASGSMYGISNAILQSSVNLLGTVAVASWALAGKIDGVYWAATSAFGAAVTTFAGQNFGAGKKERVKDSFKVSLWLFMPLTAAMCTAILILTPTLLPFFTDDLSVNATTREVILYFVPYYMMWTLIEILSGIMRGCGEVKAPVVISALGVCLFRVIWVMTVCAAGNTIFTVSICYPISWFITDIAMLVYYLHWRKRL